MHSERATKPVAFVTPVCRRKGKIVVVFDRIVFFGRLQIVSVAVAVCTALYNKVIISRGLDALGVNLCCCCLGSLVGGEKLHDTILNSQFFSDITCNLELSAASPCSGLDLSHFDGIAALVNSVSLHAPDAIPGHHGE